MSDSSSWKFKAKRLEGKVAIVTAATSGIGLAIAERLGHEGAKVAISSRKKENVESAVKHLVESGLSSKSVFGCICHVGKQEDREKLVQLALEKFGKINILVNNAGINPVAADIMNTSEESWDKLFEVNVKAGFLLTKLVVPHMLKNGGDDGGSVIFNSSITAYTIPQVIATYAVTKTVLLGLTKALAGSLASKGIRVNCISPGIIQTNFSKALWEGVDPTQVSTSMKHGSDEVWPMIGRFGRPDECAGVVAFLCSEDASYVTGESIVIGGGALSRL